MTQPHPVPDTTPFARTVTTCGAALCMGLAACGGGGDTGGITVNAGVVQVSIQPTSVSVAPGASTQLTATARDADNNTVAGVTITWSSDNNAIASVSSGGVVTGVSPGTAQVTATASGKSGSVSVVVALPRFNLVVIGAGTGSGTVTSNPAGVSCTIAGGTATSGCTGSFTSGTLVTVSASGAGGNNFVAWGGDCGGIGGSSCQLSMTQGRTVSASFAPATVTITTSASPANGGTTGGGGTYNVNSPVQVTATPSVGFGFQNWTENGAQVSSSANYPFTATTSRNLVANFSPSTFTLTITGSGIGGGKVTAPATNGAAAIDCTIANAVATGSCSRTYPSATAVALTATPTVAIGSGGGGSSTASVAPGDLPSTFSGWSGDCSGASLQCNVTMNQTRAVGAGFGTATAGDNCNPLALAFPGAANGTISAASCTISGNLGASYRFTATGAGAASFTSTSAFYQQIDVATEPPGNNVVVYNAVDFTPITAEWLLPAGQFRFRVRALSGVGTYNFVATSVAGNSNNGSGCTANVPYRILVTSGTYTNQSFGVGDCRAPDQSFSDYFYMSTPKPCTITMTPTGFDADIAIYNANTGAVVTIVDAAGFNAPETVNLASCSTAGKPLLIYTNAVVPGAVGTYSLTINVVGGGSVVGGADALAPLRPVPPQIDLSVLKRRAPRR